jgi:hypothetical protein
LQKGQGAGCCPLGKQISVEIPTLATDDQERVNEPEGGGMKAKLTNDSDWSL